MRSIFVGFFNYPDRHQILLKALITQLGTDIIYSRPWDNSSTSGDLTLEMMDRANKHLLILYNDKDVVEGETFKS